MLSGPDDKPIPKMQAILQRAPNIEQAYCIVYEKTLPLNFVEGPRAKRGSTNSLYYSSLARNHNSNARQALEYLKQHPF